MPPASLDILNGSTLSLTCPCTGWLTVWGWQATLASVYYLAATQIQGLITLTQSSYNAKPWHAVLLFWASMVFTIFVNTVIGKYLPKFEGFILILHILGFFAILLPLAILQPHQNASEVFKTFLNTGDWPTQGLSFMIGIIGSVYTFTGISIFPTISNRLYISDITNRGGWCNSRMFLSKKPEPQLN